MHITSKNSVSNVKTGFFYGYWILAVCFLCQFLKDGTFFYSFGLYVKPLTETFSWDRGPIMLGSTIASLGMGLTSPIVGSLAARFGAKKMMAVGAITPGVAFAILSLMREMWQFYILEAIVGFASSAAGPIPASMVLGKWFVKRRGFAIGILGMGIGAGGFIMPRIISSVFIPLFGWRGSFLISGILCTGILVPFILLVIKPEPQAMGFLPDGMKSTELDSNGKAVSDRSDEGLTMPQVRKTAAFWLLALALATFGFSNSALFQNQIPYLEDIGFATTAAAAAFSFVGIGSAIGKFGFGWLCDFIQAKYTLIIGIICQIFAVIILMTIKTTSPILLLWTATLMFGLGVGSWLPALSMSISSVFGMADYGTIFGMISLIFHVGGAIGPVVAGFIYDVNRSYFWAFILALILYAISLPATLLIRRPEWDKKP